MSKPHIIDASKAAVQPGDSGPGMVMVGRDDGQIVVDFIRDVRVVRFSPRQAMAFADQLMAHAKTLDVGRST